uniref:Uncharacterized protein n=1 Tax=Arundo donax TaxID=35708 RepID=A0A0A9BHY6_ARUDO
MNRFGRKLIQISGDIWTVLQC